MRFRTFPLLNAVAPRLEVDLAVSLVSVLTIFWAAGPTSAQAQQTFTYSGSTPAINISGSADGQQSSTIDVTNPSGTTVQTVSVTISGLTVPGATPVSGGAIEYESLLGAAIWLQGPSGEKIVLLGSTGDGIDGNDQEGSTSGLKNATITIADSASGFAPGDGVNYWTPQGGTFTVKPSSYMVDQAFSPSSINVTYPGEFPHDDGSATLTSIFGNGASVAAGNWQLFVATIDPNLPTPLTINSWSITFTYAQSTSTQTTTTLSSSANPVQAGNNTTFTATVTASGTTVNSGSVTFTTTPDVSGGSATTLCSGVAVSGGHAQCTASANTLGQGISSIAASYSPGTGFLASSTSMNELVEGTSSNTSGTTWCNTGSVSIPNVNPSQAYPSIIKVSGYASGATVSTVSVDLKDLSGSEGIGAQYLLVAPNGQNLDFLDDAFNAVSASGINLTIEDDAGQFPTGTPASGNYEPYDGEVASFSDAFPSSSAPSIDSAIPQVPGTINYPAPHGSSSHTLSSSFNNAPANGVWALYTVGGNAQTVAGGWCIDLTINTGVGSTTTVSPSQNPATPGQTVTYTAAVTSGGSPVTSGGTVTFLDNNVTPGGTVSGNNVVNVNTTTGKATFASSSLFDAIDLRTSTADVFEGDHMITGTFSGTVSDNPSEGSIVERLDNATTFSAGSGNSFNACNSGPVYSGQGNSGPFTPNPSNIFVANLPGTVSSVSLTLNNFFTSTSDVINNVESMVEGPNKVGLDFFSGTGGSTPNALTEGNYTFSDSIGSLVPTSSFGPGSYLPTSRLTNDTFTSSVSGFYNKPSSFVYSAPVGAATFESTFGGINPNGTWSLFFDMNVAQNATGAANGWCLNFTENPVSVTVAEGHTGTGTGGDFVQGETGAQITTTITNDGNGPTGDPLGTNPLKLTDTLNSALTYTGFSGTGWTCSAAGQVVTCTNDSAVAQSSTYPTLTLNVNVATSASGSISNSASVSGAGITSNSGSDTITILATAVLAVSKSHSGTFTQGSTAQWSITVSNTASNGSTSGSVTVADILPTGYTLNTYSSTSSLWTCGGSNAVTCTASPGIAAGGSSTITLTVNVPNTSPTSVSNTAVAWGGGDLVHTSSATAAVSNTDTVTVIQVPSSIAINAGNNQSATIDNPFATALVIVVKDAAGVVISGTSVTFTVSVGANGQGGTFSNSATTITTTTNGSGQATEAITANSKAGAYAVTAQAGTSGPSTSFTLTNTAGAPAGITVVSGNNQSATILTPFALALTVSVTDAGGNPVPGVTVTYTAPPVGASATFNGGVNTATTNASGNASVTAIANIIAGFYNVTASTNGKSTTFSLTNTPGAPANISVTSGSGQATAINTAFASPLIATVTDIGGNALSGINVTFTAPTGLTPTLKFSNASNTITMATNGAGQASSGAMTANSFPGGPYNVQAAVNSLTVNFQLTNLGKSLTTFASLTTTAASIDVFGFGFSAPVGTVSFTDLTTSSPVTPPVTLNTANAKASLLPMVSTSTGANTLPVWTVLGDLNGDGKLDLITSLFQTDSIRVQLGNGDGTFQAATNILISAGFGPAESHLFSLRGNGLLDLVVASFNKNEIAVLLGNGNGTFETPVFYTVGTSTNWPSSLTAGDFNHDGKLDIAVANTGDGTVSILLGNGTGTLTASGPPFRVGHEPEAIRAGDFNNDGYSDLVVANYADGTVTTLLNNQAGGFTATTLAVGTSVDSGPQALAITGTGSGLKLAVANYRQSTVSVMNSNGNGTFTAQTLIPVGKGPDDVNFADFNGTENLVVSNYVDGTVDLLLAGNGGAYTLAGPFKVGNNPYSATVGDIDSDGTPDVVVSNCFSNSTGSLLSGTQIAVPYSGLSLVAGHSVQASYTAGAGSEYGSSTSSSALVP